MNVSSRGVKPELFMASEYWESSALQILRLAEKSLGFRELKRWMGFLNKNDWENFGGILLWAVPACPQCPQMWLQPLHVWH